MDKRVGAAVLLAMTGAFLWLANSGRSPRVPSPPPAIAAKRKLVTVATAAQERMALPVRADSPDVPPELPDSHPCDARWETLTQKSLNELTTALRNGNFPLQSNAPCAATEKALGIKSPWSEKELKDCSKLISRTSEHQSLDAKDQRILEGCVSGLLLYRAQIVDNATRSENNFDVLDLSTLTNKLLATFVRSDFSPEAIDHALRLADAIIKKEPDLYAAHKSKALLLFAKTTDYDDPEAKRRFFEAIENCRSFDVVDEQIVEAPLAYELIRVKDNNEAFGDVVKAEQATNPSSPVLHYYYASYLWKNGDKVGALKAVDFALARDPKNARYLETRASLSKAKVGDQESHFSIKMDVSFDDPQP